MPAQNGVKVVASYAGQSPARFETASYMMIRAADALGFSGNVFPQTANQEIILTAPLPVSRAVVKEYAGIPSRPVPTEIRMYSGDGDLLETMAELEWKKLLGESQKKPITRKKAEMETSKETEETRQEPDKIAPAELLDDQEWISWREVGNILEYPSYKVWTRVQNGRFQSKRVGRQRLVSLESVREYFADSPEFSDEWITLTEAAEEVADRGITYQALNTHACRGTLEHRVFESHSYVKRETLQKFAASYLPKKTRDCRMSTEEVLDFLQISKSKLKTHRRAGRVEYTVSGKKAYHVRSSVLELKKFIDAINAGITRQDVMKELHLSEKGVIRLENQGILTVAGVMKDLYYTADSVRAYANTLESEVQKSSAA